MSKEAMKLALEALEDVQYYGWGQTERDYDARTAAITALREALAQQPAQQEPAGWRPATFHRDNLTFNPGLPDEQTVKFWKLQGVEIEYCYTTPQPAQQEPVAQYIGESSEGSLVQLYDDVKKGTNLYTSPPAQRKPLTDELNQIAEDLRFHGLTLVKTKTGYAVLKLGQFIAHSIKENT